MIKVECVIHDVPLRGAGQNRVRVLRHYLVDPGVFVRKDNRRAFEQLAYRLLVVVVYEPVRWAERLT